LIEASADTNASYWAQRYRIFSKYDDGIWLTDDAWFGVTPEPVAKLVNPIILFYANPSAHTNIAQ
jgi:hypothetical protein